MSHVVVGQLYRLNPDDQDVRGWCQFHKDRLDRQWECVRPAGELVGPPFMGPIWLFRLVGGLSTLYLAPHMVLSLLPPVYVDLNVVAAAAMGGAI
jgi:hypothetical protein